MGVRDRTSKVDDSLKIRLQNTVELGKMMSLSSYSLHYYLLRSSFRRDPFTLKRTLDLLLTYLQILVRSVTFVGHTSRASRLSQSF